MFVTRDFSSLPGIDLGLTYVCLASPYLYLCFLSPLNWQYFRWGSSLEEQSLLHVTTQESYEDWVIQIWTRRNTLHTNQDAGLLPQLAMNGLEWIVHEEWGQMLFNRLCWGTSRSGNKTNKTKRVQVCGTQHATTREGEESGRLWKF